MDYGYFDPGNYTPEEIIVAAGLVPKRILGNPNLGATGEADKYLEPTLCLYARNLLDQAITGQFKDYAGILVTHGCDCSSREFDIWKLHAAVQALHYLHVPLKAGVPAFNFFMTELNRFKTHLEAVAGAEITPEQLDAAIDLCNQTRDLLRELASYRQMCPLALTGTEFFHAVLEAQTADKDSANAMLAVKIEEVKARAPVSGEEPRVLLTGTPLDYPDIIEIVERAGLAVVADTMAVGMDYLTRTVNKTGDPLGDIARSILTKPSNPTKHPPDAFLDGILEMAKTHQVRGII